MQRLTSSPAPFVVLTREVRWHAGLPYSYPHMSLTRGKRARWCTKTSIVSCTLLSSWAVKSGDTRGYLMVTRTFRQPGANEPVDVKRVTSSSAPFAIQGQWVGWQAEIPYGHLRLSSTEGNEFDGIRMMLVVQCWSFSKFLQVFTLVIRKHSSPTTREILLCWAGTIECNGEGSAGRDIDRPNDVLLEWN